MKYLKDPEAIYRESFATIRSETAFDNLPEDVSEVAVRLIHACGMTDIPPALGFSPDAVRAGIRALSSGCPVLCDVRMVEYGIIQRFLPAENNTWCCIDEMDVAQEARKRGVTRSAVATEHWLPYLLGSVVVIGNAPTALFRLLEGVEEEGWPHPALILGFPVGFVGAAESKIALAEKATALEIPFMTLHGRRGGSAIAAAALNAIAVLGQKEAGAVL
ncbi:MAG: precorrin-8X methylmutase [bacterium]